MAKPSAIVFDLGNVVFTCSAVTALTFWAEASGQSLSTIQRKLDLEDPVHHQFERGEISETAFRQFVSAQIGFELSEETFRTGWNSIYGDEIAGARELIKNLGDRFRVIGLTNTNRTHELVWRAKYAEVLRPLEKIFSSPEIGARKPERRAYEVCAEYLGVPYGDLVFLDDNVENVRAASELGITAILVESFAQMERELRSVTSTES